MKKIFTLLALSLIAIGAYAANIINILSVEDEYYVPSDSQYAPYRRVDMYGEDGLKYSFVIEKRLDANGALVLDRVYTLSDMDDWASYVMVGMLEYYDYTSVRFVKSLSAEGKTTYTVDVTDERRMSYTLRYDASAPSYNYTAAYGQACYFGNVTGVTGDWLLLLADKDENVFAELDITSIDGEHIAGIYSTDNGKLSVGNTIVVVAKGDTAVITSGSVNLSCIDMDGGEPAYNVTAALQDAAGRNFVVAHSILSFYAYDLQGYLLDPTGQQVDYTITLKDTSESALESLTAPERTEHATIRLHEGRLCIEHNGRQYRLDGTRLTR